MNYSWERKDINQKTILAKDNESEIRMLNNGKRSCTTRSKHVAIKYFWCTDRIKNGNIIVKHCPTERMLADYMSKPLQGKLFTLFRDVIMGWKHLSTLFDILNSNEERVGNNGNLPVESGKQKLTYAEIVNASTAVDYQNKIIAAKKQSIAATTIL